MLAEGLHSPELWLLTVSLIMNFAALGAIVHVIRGRGGMAYLKSIVLKDNEATVDAGSRARRQMYGSLPLPLRRPVVFLGDSITVACEWHEVYRSDHPILNRGIGGDTSLGVLERIAEICRLDPVAVFLMIGTNDPQMLGATTEETRDNIRAIMDAILKESPDARIYLQSVLPSRVPKFNAWSEDLNRKIRPLCDGWRIQNLDMRGEFSDESGGLHARYSYDGLHLNSEGYLLWRERIRPILDELARSRTAKATA